MRIKSFPAKDLFKHKPSDQIGPLYLEHKLGSDPECSSVWSVTHVEQHVGFAIKLFSIPLGGTSESRELLTGEWEALRQLQHPGIVRCLGGGFEGNVAYIASSLIEGENLEEQVTRRGRLHWETVLDYADVMTDAMIHAHSLGIVHGALEPDKVMIEPLGDLKLLDFRVDRFDSPYQTNQPPSASLYSCRAPELIVSPQNLSPKCDLYSLGALLYYGITGQSPISGASPQDVASRAAMEIPQDVSSLVLDCPIYFSSLIGQLLSKDPADRPYSAEATKLALTEVRAKSASGVGVAEFAAGGFSPLQMDADKEEAKQVLGRVEKPEKPEPTHSFYESSWFLLLALVSLLGFVAWYMMPPGEDQLRLDAEAMLAGGDRTDLRLAKEHYLNEIVQRFPEGQHHEWALDKIDEVDMIEAEYQVHLRLDNGRPIRNEAARLYAKAWEYEQFGDLLTALEQYQGMVTLLDDQDPKIRPYVNLARRQIKRIESDEAEPSQRKDLIETQLAKASALEQEGKLIQARRIRNSIVTLYGEQEDSEELVGEAQQSLSANAKVDETE